MTQNGKKLRRRLRRLVGVATVSALVVAACGGDDDDAGSPATESADGTTTSADGTTTSADGTAEAPQGMVEGCGDSAFTDLTPDPNGSSLHCEPGYPLPQPLAERRKLTLAFSSTSSETALPVMLGLKYGEFEKENLELDVQVLPPADSYPLLAQGTIDALPVTGLSAAVYNAVAQGFDIRAVMGVNYPQPGTLEGLWAKSDIDLTNLEGRKIGSSTGLGSPVIPYMNLAMKEHGYTAADVSFEVIPTADIGQAFRAGGVDAAVLIEPFYLDFVDDPDYHFLVQAVPPGEVITSVFFGPNLLTDDREAGEAFIRALTRVVSTYLADEDYRTGLYREDIQSILNAPDTYFELPGRVWDWEIKNGTIEKLQAEFMELGAVEYDEPLSDSDLVDRTFIEAVLGIEY